MATRIQVVFFSMYGHVYRLGELRSASDSERAGLDYLEHVARVAETRK